MIIYAIDLLTVPEICFACRVDVENYKNRFDRYPGFLEIALCEGGTIVYKHEDGTIEYAQAGSCIPMLQNVCCCTYALNNERQKHTTVGVSVQYRQEKIDSADVDVMTLKQMVHDHRTILLPYHEPLGDFAHTFSEKLKDVIRKYNSTDPADALYALSSWYEMTAGLTNFVLQKLEENNIPPSAERYLKTARRYIELHFREKLDVQAVADHLGITKGYLHHIFQTGLHCGVNEYVNRRRIEEMKQYIRSRDLLLCEAAEQVGFSDPAYASRLFRKLTGLTFRQYRQECHNENGTFV